MGALPHNVARSRSELLADLRRRREVLVRELEDTDLQVEALELVSALGLAITAYDRGVSLNGRPMPPEAAAPPPPRLGRFRTIVCPCGAAFPHERSPVGGRDPMYCSRCRR